MDRITIKALIDALEASDLSELEYSQDGATLRLVKAASPGAARAVTPPPAIPTVEAPQAAASTAAPTVEFCSPLYGVVHLRPSPDAPTFVQPGQTIRAGQSLCTIEAMKAFTELRAEADGVIEAVLVETGQEVESGQPLFRIG